MKLSSYDRFFALVTGAFIALFIYLNVNHPVFFRWLCQEDGIIENLEFVFYFLSALLMFLVYKKGNFKNIWFLGFCILFFVVAGEEISWGQRILGIKTPPAFAMINVQKETTLHNINGIHQHVRMVAVFFISVIAYFIPISNRSIRFKNRYQKYAIPIFPPWSSALIAVAIFFMLVPRVIYHKKDFNTDEIAEVFLGLAFFIFSFVELVKCTRYSLHSDSPNNIT